MKLMCKIRGYNNSRKPTLSELHNIMYIIAIENWEFQLNKLLDPSSESGCKLVIYTQLQPLPPSYVLANMSVMGCWTLAAICGGHLPLAVEKGCFPASKLHLKDRLCTLCNTNSVEYVPHFVLFYHKYNNI